jgi:diguanylate cyclase (GGDEF)-like protein
MEPSTKQQSLLATVSEQMAALEKRDWEVWLVSAGVGITIGIGILALLFRAAFIQHGSLRLNVAVSPVFFFGFVAILVLFNIYVISKRIQLRRTRQQVISTTIQSELVRLQSFTDPLTEVYNRRALEDIARRFIGTAKRQGKPLTFMMLDVDQFKEINTRFGHLMGDFVLAEVATILRGAVRGSDAVIRYGGDEFLAILYNSNFQGGQVVANRIAGNLADWNGEEHLKDFELSFSIGIAEWSEGKLLDEMLDSADQAMYSTKALHKLARTNPSEASAPEPSTRARTLAGN